MKNTMPIALGTSKTPILFIIRAAFFMGSKLMAKTIFLTLLITTLPSFGSAIRELRSDTTNHEALKLLFNEISNEGHLKSGDKVLVITRENDEYNQDYFHFGDKNEIEFVANTDTKKQSSFQNEYFDFVFTHDFSKDKVFIHRILKKGGIATYKYTGNDRISKIRSYTDYKVVYFRHHESASIVTLQKSNDGPIDIITKLPSTRRLLGLTMPEEKREVLENLEDVLLEPPRAARSRSYLKKTKYLPDLLGDSFDSYTRRVFIDVGPPEKTESAGDLSWFGKHYPTRNKDFEMYRIDTVAEVSSGDEVAQIGMSDWLRRNVREEEYVVMKAEAEIVEEMEKNKALSLVDELFLECKYQGVKGQSRKSRRAYWECLALYGRLRDEGVAVHQWWG